MARDATDGNAFGNVVMAKQFSRRNLFRLRFDDLSELVSESLKAPKEDAKKEQEKEWRIRPPGAISDSDAFASACDRCKLCSEACPYGVILHEGVTSDEDEGLPYLEPQENPCRWCPSMACIEACPTKALAFSENGKVPPIAKVSLDLATCLTQQGILCDTCAYRCPASVKAIRMAGRSPIFNPGACVGCGLCVYHCDSEPSSFTIYRLNNEA